MVNKKSKSICKVIESDLIEKKVSDLQSSEIVYLFLEEIDNDFDEFKKSFFERHQFDLNAEPFNRFVIICNCWVANPPMESAIIKETFTLLEVYRKIAFSCKDEIEQLLGFDLEWNRLDSKKASYICTYIKGLDFKKQDNYPQLMEQIIDLVLKMRKVFPQFM